MQKKLSLRRRQWRGQKWMRRDHLKGFHVSSLELVACSRLAAVEMERMSRFKICKEKENFVSKNS
jgi:hypothetical protein